MTKLSEIKEMLSGIIPDDLNQDGIVNDQLIKIGVIDMSSALKIGNLEFTDTKYVDDDGNDVDDVVIEPSLSIQEVRLASYFCYILYLEKLKLILNNDAINFSTLTFSIKGLEKRPEAIADQIYITRRYLDSQIDMLSGSDAILGNATQFGSSSGGDYYG